MYIHNNTKQLLDDIITDMASNKEDFVKNPDKDFIRNRKLNFESTIKLILGMKGASLKKELYNYFGRDPDAIATSSAFIQQRDKLNDNVFEFIFHAFNESMTDFKTFKGYRLYAVDGSDINIALNRESDTYVKPQKTKNGGLTSGYNQYHLNAIYDLLNKVYVDASLQPKPQADERRAFIDMLEKQEYQDKSLFIADRGYPSWNMFLHFKYKDNADYLIRVKNAENNIVKALPMTEFDITKNFIISTNQYDRGKDGYIIVNKLKGKQKNRKYDKNRTTKATQWDFDDIEHISFRIVRFKITEDTYETIFTFLPREKFSIEDIKTLYGMRWGIETSFRELKYIIGLTNLHAKREDFVIQEIFAKLTMYNFAERLISYAVVKQDAGRKYKYQVNYTMGMQICLDFFRTLVKSDDLYTLILKYIEPIKPGRSDIRKMKHKSFVCFTYRVAA